MNRPDLSRASTRTKNQLNLFFIFFSMTELQVRRKKFCRCQVAVEKYIYEKIDVNNKIFITVVIWESETYVGMEQESRNCEEERARKYLLERLIILLNFRNSQATVANKNEEKAFSLNLRTFIFVFYAIFNNIFLPNVARTTSIFSIPWLQLNILCQHAVIIYSLIRELLERKFYATFGNVKQKIFLRENLKAFSIKFFSLFRAWKLLNKGLQTILNISLLKKVQTQNFV